MTIVLSEDRVSDLHWRVKDMRGQRFGRLLVLEHAGQSGASRNHRWLCRCDCGAQAIVAGASLRCGESKSCGCFQREISRRAGDRTRTHGKSKAGIYGIWASMRQRCEDSAHKDFVNYGARGVSVCERWKSFDAFFADMGDRPAGKTLNRKNNDAGYSPDNCEWATLKQQARNTRASRMVTHGGETRCLAEWADAAGMKYATLSGRLNNGWCFARAIETPVIPRSRRVQMS